MSADGAAAGSPGRGLLLVLDGPEGVGKSTQVVALVDRLRARGRPAEHYREPGGTPLGDAVRRLLLDPGAGEGEHPTPAAEALLYVAARAQLVDRLHARLAAGTVVVLDRFFLSTYAYQIAGRGLPAELVRQANRLAVGALVPDLTLLLACPREEAERRMRARGALDRIEQEAPAFHARVAAAFAAAADPDWQQRHPEVGPVAIVDAAGRVATVAARIDRALAARWPETFSLLDESE